ncbi:hypothetical protein OJAV_G00124710 [Oryzias javanicus]|uniref:Uncharacterized protein n=1 Tax=Oryzias javanicus TaxID=123683 RepID=A0A437CTF6_ORYJA|nr:hypothetical protein OJAV_G00124710 [Oryzias javanicus]
MKSGRALAVLVGGVFFLAVMSLYRMLDLMQGAEPQPRGEWSAGQFDQDLSRLRNKIDGLERLLVSNNRMVAMLRDSLHIHKQGGANDSAGSSHFQREPLPGCRLAGQKDSPASVQLLDVYDLLPFDNPDGGAWKQGFQISYQGNEWAEQPLELFLVPHSHNDQIKEELFFGFLGRLNRLADGFRLVEDF